VIALLWPFFRLALRKPQLIPLLIGAGWRFRRLGWYRHPPFLPLPTQDYMRWRMYTAYGSSGRSSSPAELERYLRWTRWMNRVDNTSGE
jgi:hypothetical protein